MKENISEQERFFSKISHDLRGSFTSILGFSDILNDPTEDLSKEEMQEFTSRIGNQSHDSFELLVNFINWLKLEKYDYGLTKEKIELLEVLYDYKEQNKRKFDDNNIALEISIDEEVTTVMDYEILYSIINNVISFMIKVCAKNKSLEIKSISDEDNYSSLEFSASYEENNSSFLQNIDLHDLNNELSFPIIFAIKFTELSGGVFNFSVNPLGNMVIILRLPTK